MIKFMVKMIKTFQMVFAKPTYAALAAAVTFVLVFGAAWMRNLTFLGFLITSPQFGIATKLKVFEWTLTNLALNTTPLRLILLISAAVLAGVNTSLLVFLIRLRLGVGKDIGASIGGMVVSALGIGCASCGSVLLTAFFGFSAGASMLAAFPLQGAEFTLAGIGLLAASIALLAKKIQNPLVCEVK